VQCAKFDQIYKAVGHSVVSTSSRCNADWLDRDGTEVEVVWDGMGQGGCRLGT